MATHRRLQRTNQKESDGSSSSRSLSNGRHMRDEMARPTSNQQQQRKRRLVSGKKRRSTDDNEDNDSRNGTSTLRNQQQQQQRNRRRPSLPTNEITYIVDDDDEDDDDDNENDEITRNVSARRHSNTLVASHGKTKGTKSKLKSNFKTIWKKRNDARDAWDDEEILDCGGPEFAPASPTDPFDQIQLPPLSPPSYSPPSYSPPVRPVTASAPRTTTILPQFMPQTFMPQPRFYPPFQASTFFPTHPQIPFSQFTPQPSVPVTTPLSTSTPIYFQGAIRPTITPPAFVPAQRPAPNPFLAVLRRRRRLLTSTLPSPHLTTVPSQRHRSPAKSKRL